jgi:hypothetical protein
LALSQFSWRHAAQGDFRMRRSLVSFSFPLAAFALLSYARVASAQDTTTLVPAPTASPPPVHTTYVAQAAAPVVDAGNDHDQVVGHFAVGYFGISNLPVGGTVTGAGTTGTVAQANIVAPIIGARYWLTPRFGIDAGVGFSASTPGWGVAIHGGVPLALATSKHMTFELIPEATLGFTGNSPGGGVTDSGLRLDVGARIGGEIQFGFIGIPQLALQASVGLYLEHDSYSASINGGASLSGSSTTVTTSVGSDPWGIFTDNISALYYF